jgi:hypothetical protein
MKGDFLVHFAGKGTPEIRADLLESFQRGAIYDLFDYETAREERDKLKEKGKPPELVITKKPNEQADEILVELLEPQLY